MWNSTDGGRGAMRARNAKGCSEVAQATAIAGGVGGEAAWRRVVTGGMREERTKKMERSGVLHRAPVVLAKPWPELVVRHGQSSSSAT